MTEITEAMIERGARAICENWGCHGAVDGSDCDGSLHISDARACILAALEGDE